jgi:hypothetical protein
MGPLSGMALQGSAREDVAPPAITTRTTVLTSLVAIMVRSVLPTFALSLPNSVVRGQEPNQLQHVFPLGGVAVSRLPRHSPEAGLLATRRGLGLGGVGRLCWARRSSW